MEEKTRQLKTQGPGFGRGTEFSQASWSGYCWPIRQFQHCGRRSDLGCGFSPVRQSTANVIESQTKQTSESTKARCAGVIGRAIAKGQAGVDKEMPKHLALVSHTQY